MARSVPCAGATSTSSAPRFGSNDQIYWAWVPAKDEAAAAHLDTSSKPDNDRARILDLSRADKDDSERTRLTTRRPGKDDGVSGSRCGSL